MDMLMDGFAGTLHNVSVNQGHKAKDTRRGTQNKERKQRTQDRVHLQMDKNTRLAPWGTQLYVSGGASFWDKPGHRRGTMISRWGTLW